MKLAALLDNNRKVIGEVYNPPIGNEIKIAGAMTDDRAPVNVSTYKISRSKRNLKKAQYCQPVDKIKTKYGDHWTFHCVENNNIVY